MMTNFRKLFSFTKKEIQEYFKVAKPKCRKSGLNLLQASIKVSNEQFGKILIIIPGKTAKAHKRNLIRRQIKAIFYEEELYKKPVVSILLVYKPAVNLTFDEIKEFLIKCI